MLLSLKNLCKEYTRGGRKFFALDNVNLDVNSGDFVNIIGRSGSGKSTLLNIIAGMLTPTSGQIVLKSECLTQMNDAELSRIRNEKIGFIPQGASGLQSLNVIENILLPFYLYNHDGDGESYARYLLDRFGISDLAEAYPSELSGGELRRALIARALINHPEIIIADEPVSDLDINSARDVMEIFAALNSEGVTLLIVSHDLESLKYGKNVYTMSEGKLHEGNLLC